MIGSRTHLLSPLRSKRLMIRLQHAVTHCLLIVGAILVLFPLFWMLSTSLKPPTQIKAFPPIWIPKPFVWSNYIRAVTIFPVPFYVFVANSTYISLLNVVAALVSNPIIAYAFARLRFRGSRTLFYLVLATMMLPGQVTMIPLFLLFRALRWVNTYNPLIIPSFFGNAYFVFLLRQFFSTIPHELDDAAKIDGCGVLGIFFRIILPLSKPALGIMAIFTFTWAWNDFMGPLIYVSEMKMYPLSVALSFLRGTYRVLWSELMVVSFIAMLPPVALYFIAQRSYIQGIVVTGIKG
ncbi:MAG: carbohydrate ABC transporter permease [Anaerolineae bacterium]|nr:carbohydrate ABC transporter permease [Anaerolineae bacterium]